MTAVSVMRIVKTDEVLSFRQSLQSLLQQMWTFRVKVYAYNGLISRKTSKYLFRLYELHVSIFISSEKA